MKIPMFGRTIAWYEQQLASAQAQDDVEKTLFVQLTRYEVVLCSFALLWVGRLYGIQAIGPLIKKFEELMEAQDFFYAGNGGGDK